MAQQGSNSSTFFQCFLVSFLLLFLVFDNSQSSRSEVVFHCGFDLHFPMTNDILIGHLNTFSGEMLTQGFGLFLNLIALYFGVEFQAFFIY